MNLKQFSEIQRYKVETVDFSGEDGWGRSFRRQEVRVIPCITGDFMMAKDIRAAILGIKEDEK